MVTIRLISLFTYNQTPTLLFNNQKSDFMKTQDLRQIADNQLKIINLQTELLQCLYSLNYENTYTRENEGY